jgi:hypothetical protein
MGYVVYTFQRIIFARSFERIFVQFDIVIYKLSFRLCKTYVGVEVGDSLK